MNKEIKKRKRRFWAMCLAAVLALCSMEPLMVEAASYIENLYDGDAPVAIGNYIYPGDIFYVQKDSRLTCTITYQDVGGREIRSNVSKDSGIIENIGVIEYYKCVVPGYTEAGGTEIDARLFICWEVVKVDVSAGGFGKFVLHAMEGVERNITYHLDDGINNPANPATYIEGIGVSELSQATKDNYVFAGWYTDPSFAAETKVTSISAGQAGDLDLYAKFTPVNYTISYELNGGANASANPTGYTYGVGVSTLAEATKNGYTFDGWYTSPNFADGTKVTSVSATQSGNLNLYAKFTPANYTISYELNGGTNATGNPTSYTYGTGVGSFAAASKTGYDFKGWYTTSDFADGTKVTSISGTETGNKTLHAKFTPVDYTISYELNGGTNAAANPTGYTYGSGVSTLAAATKNGYTFEGWYTTPDFADGTKVTSVSTTQTGNVTLYAKFTAVDYTISYELNGGANASANPTGYTYGVGVSTLAAATKNGYTFEGWYTSPNFTAGTKLTSVSATQTGNLNLYAKFTAVDYTISYELNGGANASANPTGYTYGVGVSSFAAATKNGYTFEGWYTTPDFADGTKVTSVSTTQTGNVTLYAKFTAVQSSSDNNDNGAGSQSGSGNITPRNVYSIEGGGGTWVHGSPEGLTVRGKGEFWKFTEVKIDGNLIDKSNYSAREGSTIITLSPEYLNTLGLGMHTLEMQWTDGLGDTAFTIVAAETSPKTGEDVSGISLFISVAALGIGILAVRKKKNWEASAR